MTKRGHVAEVARNLRGIVPEIRIVEFHELIKPAKDISDWLEQGGTAEQLLTRAKAGRLPSKGYTLVWASSRATSIGFGQTIYRAIRLSCLLGCLVRESRRYRTGYAACVTTGVAWPDGANGQDRRNVIMMTAEDVLDDTLVPRLIAAGADLNRIAFLKCIHKDDKDRMFYLADDLLELEEMIVEVGNVGLVTVDPITAYMGSGKFDSHRTTDVRSQLSPLKDLSEKHTLCISAITHPAKNAGLSALNQFIGSQAFIAAARFGHLCVEEIEADGATGNRKPSGRMLYTQPKHNPVKRQATLAYRITDATGGVDFRTGFDVRTSKIVWEGPVDISADEALAATSTKKERSNAVRFLMDMLANGPVAKTKIDERAVAHGLSESQLKTGKAKMHARSFRERGKGPDGAWFWCLAEHYPTDGVEDD